MQEAEKIFPKPSIYSLSERAVTINFGDQIIEQVLATVTAYSNYVTDHPFPGFITAVPAYTSLTVFFDPLLVIRSDNPGNDCYEKVSNYLHCLKPSTQGERNESTITTIPVWYGGQFGPDLEEVASVNQLSVADVIRLHSEAVYTVYMIGFVPGFAYLGGMNELLATPRKATPRKAVPAGSVGIAGQQTGIYPLTTPGGWQIIGQTPLTMFDAARSQPSLLQAGYKVMFKPINQDEFNNLKAGQ